MKRMNKPIGMDVMNFYPVGHYLYNPGGVPTAMITAWYIARSIVQQAGKA